MEEPAIQPHKKFEEIPGTISPKQALEIAKKEFGITVGHKKIVEWCEFHKCCKQPGGIGGKIYIDPVEFRAFLAKTKERSTDGKNIGNSDSECKKSTLERADSETQPKTRRTS